MTFTALILNAAKQTIASASFPTWSEAAKFLREDQTEGRKYSSIVIPPPPHKTDLSCPSSLAQRWMESPPLE